MKKTPKALLAVSLILNVLFAGIILGSELPRLLHMPLFTAQTDALIAKLPENKRALFESTMQPALRQMAEERRHINEAKSEALRIVKNEPFSMEAYMTQNQHISDMSTQMKRHMAEAVSALANQFSQDERFILADILASLPPQNSQTNAANIACDKKTLP